MDHVIKIAPSILAADFAHLADAIQSAEAAGADYIHIDVMDGHFVPNITVGQPIVRSLRAVTRLPLDVHLMISDPMRHIPAFVEAGANILTFHIEATPHAHRALQQIRDLGARPGITLNPATPAAAISEVLPAADLVLVLTVDPGFGGQTLIESTLHKVAQVREMLERAGSQADLEVDGGVDRETAMPLAAAGATVLVAGTAIFQAAEGVAAAVEAIRAAALRGRRAEVRSWEQKEEAPARQPVRRAAAGAWGASPAPRGDEGKSR